MTKALSHTKKRERTVIVVGEFGEEESAHFDDGANKKKIKNTHTHTQKKRGRTSPAKEKAGLVGWLGRAWPALAQTSRWGQFVTLIIPRPLYNFFLVVFFFFFISYSFAMTSISKKKNGQSSERRRYKKTRRKMGGVDRERERSGACPFGEDPGERHCSILKKKKKERKRSHISPWPLSSPKAPVNIQFWVGSVAISWWALGMKRKKEEQVIK